MNESKSVYPFPYPFEWFALFSVCTSYDKKNGYQRKPEYHWGNIFKTSIVALTIPVSLYAYAKNYSWVNNQLWNLFKR